MIIGIILFVIFCSYMIWSCLAISSQSKRLDEVQYEVMKINELHNIVAEIRKNEYTNHERIAEFKIETYNELAEIKKTIKEHNAKGTPTRNLKLPAKKPK